MTKLLFDGICGALADRPAVRQINAAHAGLGGKVKERGTGRLLAAIPHAPCQIQGGFAFRRVIVEAGQCGAADQLRAVCAIYRQEIRRQPVAEGDGACLVQDHGIHIATGLHGLAGHGDHIKPGDPVHTGDADGGQQPADRGGQLSQNIA